jgi:hypothetical protein
MRSPSEDRRNSGGYSRALVRLFGSDITRVRLLKTPELRHTLPASSIRGKRPIQMCLGLSFVRVPHTMPSTLVSIIISFPFSMITQIDGFGFATQFNCHLLRAIQIVMSRPLLADHTLHSPTSFGLGEHDVSVCSGFRFRGRPEQRRPCPRPPSSDYSM